MDYKQTYQAWLEADFIDEETRQELLGIQDNEKEIEDRFYKDLEFGTAGLRGVIGAGSNRMNIYVVRRATQGLANYMLAQGNAHKGVAIAYDSRRMSKEFATEVGCCLVANQIPVYIFDSLRPTPQLSFAIRHLGCGAGINITASHNPPEYNGYKVYWEDGAQITPPHDKGIMDEVKAIVDMGIAKHIPLSKALETGLYHIIGKEVDDAYIQVLKEQILHQDSIDAYGKDLRIVYSPLHGTGNIPVRRILSEIGFTNVYVVAQQELPDGDFPTVAYPNPEAKEAFDLALALAKEVDADLVLATDPDADRLGVYVKDKEGIYHSLTGNMSGCLLAEYELSQRKALKGLPKDGRLIKTIVTTNLADAIGKAYNVEVVETLTGFKYIGQQILGYEKSGIGEYLFGFEESYGCLIGTYARDKDAVVATMALCEAAAYYKGQNMTLWDKMVDIYETYGYYLDGILSIELKGIEGLARIGEILSYMRENDITQIGSEKVLAFRDYKSSIRKDFINQQVEKITLPVSDVLYYELENNSWICVRPSGTEPKLKFYYGVKADTRQQGEEKAAILEAAIQRILEEA